MKINLTGQRLCAYCESRIVLQVYTCKHPEHVNTGEYLVKEEGILIKQAYSRAENNNVCKLFKVIKSMREQFILENMGVQA